MTAKKFKFVSPGVFINEIDNSQLPDQPERIGPVVIGRTERGPSMRPVQVDSFSDFIEIFGNPIPGKYVGDVWRDGNYVGPTYAAYAAQAYLRNNSPVTIVRLLGEQHDEATTTGKAGWRLTNPSGSNTAVGTADDAGGAYGLFVANDLQTKTQNAGAGEVISASLAAVIYLQQGDITLKGTTWDGSTTTGSAATWVKSDSGGKASEFRLIIRDGSQSEIVNSIVNFDENSNKYIRNVLNTNPQKTNSDINTSTEKYFLGETYELSLNKLVTGSAGQQVGCILGLANSSYEKANYRMGTKPSKTGWFFAQDLQVRASASVDNSEDGDGDTAAATVSNGFLPTSMQKLFRLIGRNTGQWEQENLKISIQDIKAPTSRDNPYGSFTLVVRRADDSDNAPRLVERFSNCNLNRNSPNFVARVVGDQYSTWDYSENRYKNYGEYPNQSKYVYISMAEGFDENPEYLPFGFYGPPRWETVAVRATSNSKFANPIDGNGSALSNAFIKGHGEIPADYALGAGLAAVVSIGAMSTANGDSLTSSLQFPTLPLRTSASDGNLPNDRAAYFGIRSVKTEAGTTFDRSYKDHVYAMPSGVDAYDEDSAGTEYSFVFTLDDVRTSSGSNGLFSGSSAYYQSGSRADGTSITCVSGGYEAVLEDGFDRFTAPMFGGFDGLNITEAEPFNNRDLDTNSNVLDNYGFNSVKRAIDAVASPEVVDMNLLCVPGLTQDGLTTHQLRVCEDRGDAMAMVDLKTFEPLTETNAAVTTRKLTVEQVVANLRSRGLNSSYGCTYYPWVQIRDSINGAVLWAPPSVVALGTFGSTETRSELWFAPAGFNRGGLTEGSAGIPVIGVREKLTSKQRDKLYDANINPIASFPAEGIVIFGQKTMQITPSALDRINVRRLMIFLKKEISRMANNILFDQNTKETWNRFLGRAIPLLDNVKSRFGLTDYKVILDETTTTEELIDRNILYAKIFLKPTRTIEYIALDFTITNTGAAFDD